MKTAKEINKMDIYNSTLMYEIHPIRAIKLKPSLTMNELEADTYSFTDLGFGENMRKELKYQESHILYMDVIARLIEFGFDNKTINDVLSPLNEFIVTVEEFYGSHHA